MNGIVNLLKPPGMTSAQAVAAVKRMTGVKTGHGGTLDPEAAGVLPILIGRATRLFDYIVATPKTYLAEIAFGAATDTQDAQGVVTSRGDCLPDVDALRRALPSFTGVIAQLPPQFSALKKNGVPMYRLARSGKTAVIQPREVTVLDIAVLGEPSRESFLLRVRCSGGTYIRTLCDDIGRLMGCPAHLRFLLRERVGSLSLSRSQTLEELKEASALQQGLCSFLIPMDRTFDMLPAVRVSERLVKRFVSGASIPLEGTSELPQPVQPGRVRLYSATAFLGVGVLSHTGITPEIVLWQEEKTG